VLYPASEIALSEQLWRLARPSATSAERTTTRLPNLSIEPHVLA